MLSDDIELVGSVMEDNGMWSHKREAWVRIKTALSELGTTPNTGSPKIPTRADFIKWLSTFESAPSASSVYDWVCRQLRAGA